MKSKTDQNLSAWIGLVVVLSITAVAAAPGEQSPTTVNVSSKGSPPPEPDEDHATEESQVSPVRLQGPAVDTPLELVEMLKQRQQVIDKREEALKIEETRLSALKKDLEDLLARHQQGGKNGQQLPKNAKLKQIDPTAVAVEQVAKMYETMPPEEAAARLEKLPTAMALQVLRSLKSKTAGTILASVKPDKAAKLTEQFLARP